jgi:hypothetical protein
MAPWGNRPAIAAVGVSLANQTAYLSRLWASGISSEDLVTFIQTVNLQFPREMQRRRPDRIPYRYVLSLDSMSGWLIDQPKYSIFEESLPVAGRIYYQAGALHAGSTEDRSRPSLYIDPATKQVRSLYQDGRSMARELNLQEVALIDDGPKHRFVFILAPRGSAEYMSYRKALPSHCREWEWGENSVGWIQPRLLARQLRAWLNSLKNGPTAPQFEPGS